MLKDRPFSDRPAARPAATAPSALGNSGLTFEQFQSILRSPKAREALGIKLSNEEMATLLQSEVATRSLFANWSRRPERSSPPPADKPPKLGLSRSGTVGLIVAGVVVLAVVAAAGGSAFGEAGSTSSESSNSSGANGDESAGTIDVGSSAGSTDPIEQARVVLGGSYSYQTVKAVTDSALSVTGTASSNDAYSRAWSAVLKVSDNLQIDPMRVMTCVTEFPQGNGLTFAEAAALCATDIHLNG